MAGEAERVEAGGADSDQDDEVEEAQYEVERIIDMRVEEGEVLYRVRWKNYCSDDDTWEPEAHLEDCREVLLAYKRAIVEAKAKKAAEANKKTMKLPTKSDVFDANSESDSDMDRPTDMPIRKKKKKKKEEEEQQHRHQREKEKEKKKKKKDKQKEEVIKPRPAPETDEEEDATSPPSSRKQADLKKRLVDSDEDAEQDTVPPKKHRKDKAKDGSRHRKEEEEKKKRGKKERRVESSEDEAAPPPPAHAEEDHLSDGPASAEAQADDAAAKEKSSRSSLDDKSKQKKGNKELKLQGIKDLIRDKKTSGKSDALAKLKTLTLASSKAREDATPLSSDSSDSSTLTNKKAKSKGQQDASVVAPPGAKVPSSSASSSSSSSSTTATAATSGGGSSKAKDEEASKEDAAGQGSTNLFEKFLLGCGEAKDRAPRRHSVHPPTSTDGGNKSKLVGKIEKRSKTSKDSPAQKAEEKTKQSDASRTGQSHGFNLDSDEKESDEFTPRSRFAEESRERRERVEEPQRSSWDRRTPTGTDDKRKKREDSEPRLFIACDDNLDTTDPLEGDKADKGQATLSLGMDLNLDWMTLDDFQKHLNGEDEMLSGPPLSPSELRDAVKSGDYMSVKLALNSKEDYNLDQEDSSGMSLCMLAAAGGQDDILRLLIKKGVRVNGRQKNGTTALMHAAEKNFLTTVAILLEAGSHVNAQTMGGETALMKGCKRGNADVVRLLLEYGADCNILSKHKHNAMYFAKVSNNLTVSDLITNHSNMLSTVADETIRAYFESRLTLLEAVFPLACHRLCEGADFSMDFSFKQQPPTEGSGVLLFIFHANFLSEVTARLCGPCSVHAVVLNDKFQLPIFLDSHFIYSFSPTPGTNKLFIRFADAPTAKVKLLICAYKVQLQG